MKYFCKLRYTSHFHYSVYYAGRCSCSAVYRTRSVAIFKTLHLALYPNAAFGDLGAVNIIFFAVGMCSGAWRELNNLHCSSMYVFSQTLVQYEGNLSIQTHPLPPTHFRTSVLMRVNDPERAVLPGTRYQCVVFLLAIHCAPTTSGLRGAYSLIRGHSHSLCWAILPGKKNIRIFSLIFTEIPHTRPGINHVATQPAACSTAEGGYCQN